jgi:prepilin-type N-terminal cleavage/methylation domain-containing protein
MRSFKNPHAFTLVEMVIVLVLLGILAALAIPTFQSLTNNSRLEGTRLASEAIAANGNALVLLAQGSDASATHSDATWVAVQSEVDSSVTITGNGDGSASVTKNYGSSLNPDSYSCAIIIVSGTATVTGCAPGSLAPATATLLVQLYDENGDPLQSAGEKVYFIYNTDGGGMFPGPLETDGTGTVAFTIPSELFVAGAWETGGGYCAIWDNDGIEGASPYRQTRWVMVDGVEVRKCGHDPSKGVALLRA